MKSKTCIYSIHYWIFKYTNTITCLVYMTAVKDCVLIPNEVSNNNRGCFGAHIKTIVTLRLSKADSQSVELPV